MPWPKGKRHSEETKAKMKSSSPRRKLDSDHVARLIASSKARKGTYHLSHEHREKISKANTGKVSPMKGKKMSPETREKMSRSHTGLKHPPEVKAKLLLVRKRMPQIDSYPERLVKEILKVLDIPFQFQIDFELPDGSWHTADIVAGQVVINVDGIYWHKDRLERDSYIDASLQAQGWKTLRISDKEVVRETVSVVHKIKSVVP